MFSLKNSMFCKKLMISLVTLVLMVSVVGVANAADWTMFGHDIENSGVADAGLTGISNPKYLWNFTTDNSIGPGSPVMGNIDDDADLEVVVPTAGFSGTPGIYALDTDGTQLWKYPTGGYGTYATPNLVDLDSDGKLEVISVALADTVFALDDDGSVLWSVSKGTGSFSGGTCTVFQGSMYPLEVVAGAAGKTYLLQADTGTEIWNANYVVLSDPAIADIDLDGAPEIMFGASGTSQIVALNDDGTTLWASTPAGQDFQGNVVIINDVNSDGHPDLAAGSRDKNLYVYSGADGTLLWSYSVIGRCFTAAAADFNGDGFDDVVTTATKGDGVESYVYVLDVKNQVLLWKHNIIGMNMHTTERGPSIVDVDEDGTLDVVVAGSSMHLYALSGIDGSELWSISTLDDDGGRSPAVGDINNDGVMDIAVTHGSYVQVISEPLLCDPEVWVDDDAGYSDTDGDDEFVTIQAAIDAVCDGGIVHVAPGNYQENLASWKDMEITKSVSILGSGSGSAIVELSEGKMNGVEIRGTDLDVLIEGLTFTRKPGNTYACNYNLRIAETTSTFTSLVLRDVEVAYAHAPNVQLGKNGVYDEVIIEDCNFHHAGSWGFYSQGTLSKMDVTDSHFDYNGVVDSSHGIGFDLSSSSGSTNVDVTGGTFNNNALKGINIVETTSATFIGVEANNNGDHGVSLWEWVSSSSDLTFSDSDFSNNGLDGFLFGTQGSTTIDNIEITCCNIKDNDRYGILLYHDYGGSVSNIDINCCNIEGNAGGIGTSALGSTIIDATCNWWGDHSGPSGGVADPVTSEVADGSGDSVGGNVHFDPYVFVDADAGGPYETVYGSKCIDFSALGSTYSSACCGGTISYLWNFGDGHTATIAEPTHCYSSSGTYTVTLTVTLTTSCGFTYSDYNISSVTVYDYDGPVIWLKYPEGGERLSNDVTVEWFAIDDDTTNLPIILYYSDDNGDTWVQINDELYNNVDECHGEYDWDISGLTDGKYLLKAEAIGSHVITADTSDPFTISNGYTGMRVTGVQITNVDIDSTRWVKDGDTIEITATIDQGTGLTPADITADLTGFNRGADFPADSYVGNVATWTLENVVCNPSNGDISVKVNADDVDTNTGSITADNTAPETSFLKPEDGYFYLFNKRLIPTGQTMAIGPITIETNSNDNFVIEKAAFFLDDELQETVTQKPFDWYMNLRTRGVHTLKVVVYDSAGNTAEDSVTLRLFNPFGHAGGTTTVKSMATTSNSITMVKTSRQMNEGIQAV